MHWRTGTRGGASWSDTTTTYLGVKGRNGERLIDRISASSTTHFPSLGFSIYSHKGKIYIVPDSPRLKLPDTIVEGIVDGKNGLSFGPYEIYYNRDYEGEKKEYYNRLYGNITVKDINGTEINDYLYATAERYGNRLNFLGKGITVKVKSHEGDKANIIVARLGVLPLENTVLTDFFDWLNSGGSGIAFIFIVVAILIFLTVFLIIKKLIS